MPNNIIKIQKKGQVVIPRDLRERVGVSEGDLLEIRIKGSQFVLTPQVVINREVLTAPGRRRKHLLAELSKTVEGLRQEAERRGLDNLTERQVSALINKARSKRPGRGIAKSSAQ